MYFCDSFWDSNFFGLTKIFFSELAQKFFKTTEKHSLAVCGSFWGENQFLLIFVPFYCFERKGLFTTNPNFPLDLTLFQTCLEKWVLGGEKVFMLIFVSFYWFDQKDMLNKFNFPQDLSLLKIVEKNKILSISELLSEIVIFCLKRDVFSEFPQKCFKTTEKHSLAVCGSFFHRIFFCLYLSSFTALNKKGV